MIVKLIDIEYVVFSKNHLKLVIENRLHCQEFNRQRIHIKIFI